MRYLVCKNKEAGIALVIVISALTLIVTLATYFFTTIRLQTSKSLAYGADMKARMLVHAGMHLAISELKYGVGGVRDSFCDTRLEPWYYSAGAGTKLRDANPAATSFAALVVEREGLDVGKNLNGNIYLKVTDAGSQLNCNDNNPNLELMLNALVAALGGGGPSGADIINYRNSLSGGKFSYEEQLRNVPNMTNTFYEELKDYITVYAWQDPKATYSYDVDTFTTTFSGDGGLNNDLRSPVNVNTAPIPVLQAVLAPVVGSGIAANVASAIETEVSVNPFFSWQDFADFIDGLGLSPSLANDIKNNANPNRIKPTPYTTEFCFHGGGYFEVEVLAEITKQNGTIVSRKSGESLVHVFDIMQHTKKSDFRDEDTNNDGNHSSAEFGEGDFNNNGDTDNTNYLRVSWLDSCPIDEADDLRTQDGYQGADPHDMSPFDYKTVINAVKLGFWDNFDEDSDTNQSRAWWGNEFPSDIEMESCWNFNDQYDPGDISEALLAGAWNGTDPLAAYLHPYDDVSSGLFSGTAFVSDFDFDNEMWAVGTVKGYSFTNFSKYYLGAQGSGLGWTPNSSLLIPYRSWYSNQGFYLRVFNYDGPRASIGTAGEFPGWEVATEPPGRDRQDVGRVELFSAAAQFYIYPIGNIYGGGGALTDGSGLYWQVDGPRFYGRVGGQSVTNIGQPGYQRDKVYMTVCRASTNRMSFYVFAPDLLGAMPYAHPTNFPLGGGYSGHMQFYSNHCPSAWDDVRIIDNNGRIARRFVLPADSEWGSFHLNCYIPDNTVMDVLFLGDIDGTIISAGVDNIDISTVVRESTFAQTSGSYVPSISVDSLGAGARIIPYGANPDIFSYSIALQINASEFEDTTPRVPALEDVSVSYLLPTEIIYFNEQ